MSDPRLEVAPKPLTPEAHRIDQLATSITVDAIRNYALGFDMHDAIKAAAIYHLGGETNG